MTSEVHQVCLDVSQTPEFQRLKKDRAKVVNALMGKAMRQYPNYHPAMMRAAIERQLDA